MAVRGKQRGVGGFVVALVVVCALLVLAIVAAVLGWSDSAKRQKDVAKAQVDKKDAVNETKAVTADKKALIARIAGPAHDSDTLEDLRKLQETKTGELAKSGGDRLKNLDPGAPLLDVIGAAKSAIDQEHGDLAAAITQAKDKDKKIEQVQQELKDLRPGFDEEVKKLTEQTNSLSAKYNKLQQDSKTALDDLKKDMDDNLAAKAKANDALQSKLDQTEQENKKLRMQLAELKPKHSATVDFDPSTMPKGQIISVGSDAAAVYINLGRAEHLPLGITFEVFDRGSLITKDSDGNINGKATIEVIRVMEHSAMARVVRLSRGATLHEGDVIGNVVYDPHQVLKFCIFGDFDIDNTGMAEPGDKTRLENMVSDWGGKVVTIDWSSKTGTKLPPDTDYLVVGANPSKPDELSENDKIVATKIKEHEAALQRFENYNRLVSEAQALKIPVLNQNRFLQLVGYYGQRPSEGAAAIH